MTLEMNPLGLNATQNASPSAAVGSIGPVRNRAITWSIFGVVFVESVYALWTASRGYFFADDFIDFQITRQLGFGGRLFEQPIFGHFIPGFTFVNYLVSSFIPYQWWIIEAIEVILFALSLILLYRLLASLFGSTWVTVPLVALAGASFSLVPSLIWWSSALEYLVAIPATLYAIICHVRYLRTNRFRYPVFGAISIAVGLAFYDGLYGSLLFIVLMTLLFWPVGPGINGAVRTLGTYWRAWLCYAIPVALELGWRFTHTNLYPTGILATVGQTFDFVSLSWTQTLIPLTFGVDAWVLPTHAERVWAGVLGEAILAVFVVVTIRRRRFAWRAWVLLCVPFFATAALVGVTRAGYFGPADAQDVKYVALDAFFLVIAVGFALLPLRSAASGTITAAARNESIVVPIPSRAARHARGFSRPAYLPAVAVFGLLVCVLAYGTALIFDQNREFESVDSHESHQFFANVSRSLASMAPVTQRAFLWDTEVNQTVVAAAFYPYDTASVTVGPLHPDVQFDVWGRKGYLLQPDGSIVPAKAVTQATVILPGSTAACVKSTGRTQDIDLALNPGLTTTTRWFGLVSYTSATGAFTLESGGATVRFPKGSGTLITAFPPAPMNLVGWIVQPHGALCITGFRVVLPEPLGTNQPAAASP